MTVIDDIDHFEKPAFSVVTIGTFDGVHIGHQAILKQLISEASANKGKSILITFWPHPRFILNKDASSLKLLSTFKEKTDLLKNLGLDYIVKIPFTPEFSSLSAQAFVEEILVRKIGTKRLFIGHDHRFGNNREGNIDFLHAQSENNGYEVFEIPKQTIDDIGISSTKIRDALHVGNLALANSLLGRSYSIHGKVVSGEQKGRTIGFPTANIEVPESYKLLPGDGAYAVNAYVDKKKLIGMLNIGFKPTVKGTQRTIEVHLFNFDEDIYGAEIIIEFVQSLRKEVRFESLEALKDQLEKDKEAALSILL